jgi:hypothetical protein
LRKRKAEGSSSEMLRDPRWQRARLETMQRARFACERCGDKETTLNVHHKNYKRDHAPWEYDLSNFVCLCRDCHEEIHAQKEMINNLLPYVSADIQEFMSGLAAASENRRYIGSLHPRKFTYNFSFNMGVLFHVLEIHTNEFFIEKLSHLLENKDFSDDLIRLMKTYLEHEDEH